MLRWKVWLKFLYWVSCFGIVNLLSQITHKHVSVETEPQKELWLLIFFQRYHLVSTTLQREHCQFPCVFYPFFFLCHALSYPQVFKIILAYLLCQKEIHKLCLNQLGCCNKLSESKHDLFTVLEALAGLITRQSQLCGPSSHKSPPYSCCVFTW